MRTRQTLTERVVDLRRAGQTVPGVAERRQVPPLRGGRGDRAGADALPDPGIRRYPLFRALEAIGGVALVIKAAEAIRDWELGGQKEGRIVIDVPPVANR